MSNSTKGCVVTLRDGTAFSTSKDTLLDDLEAHNIAIEYHCREGFCGACRCKIISGEVDYTTDPLAFIDDDEILPCCTVALSDVTLDI